MRDTVVNNALHIAEENMQVRVNTIIIDQEFPDFLVRDTTTNTNFKLCYQAGFWSHSFNMSGVAARLRVRVRGFNETPAGNSTFRVIIAPRALFQFACRDATINPAAWAYKDYEANDTDAWLSSPDDYLIVPPSITSDQTSIKLFETSKAIGVANPTVQVPILALSLGVFVQEDDARLTGVYVAEYGRS